MPTRAWWWGIHRRKNTQAKRYLSTVSRRNPSGVVELSAANTVSICDTAMFMHNPSDGMHAAFNEAVRSKKIQVFEHAHIDRLEQNAVVLHRANPTRPNDPPEEITVPNDLVLSFRGIERSLVDHLEVDHAMMKSIGVKMENTWDWKRYTWLAFAFVASGIFYYEKKTLYDSIGLGTMLGVIAIVVGGFY